MNQFDQFSEKSLLIWTCVWAIIAVALRLLTWRDATWMITQPSHYAAWLLLLRSFAGLAALIGCVLLRWKRR